MAYSSTISLRPGYINVYDSLNLNLDTEVQDQIYAILKQESTFVTVNKVPIQQQQGMLIVVNLQLPLLLHSVVGLNQISYC